MNDTEFTFLKQMGWAIKRRHKFLWNLKINSTTLEIKKRKDSWSQVKTTNIIDTKLNRDWFSASIKNLVLCEYKIWCFRS